MPDETDTTSTDDTTTDTSTDTGDDTTTGSDGTDDATSATETENEAKWKAMARKHEKEAKAARAEADKLRQATLSDQEKALEDAKSQGKAEAASEYASLLAAARLEAAGVPAEIVEDLNLAKFIDEDGTVNAEKVAATAKKHKAAGTAGSADGGPQGGDPSTPKQLTESDLKNMTPEQIVEAQTKGQLKTLMGAT